jgi:fumarate hydratase subunit alpha
MRRIKAPEIEEKVKELFIESNLSLAPGVLEALERAYEEEISPLGKEVLKELLENARVAREERIPLCQDTGLPVVFLEVGNEVLIEGDLKEAIKRGIKRGTEEGFLRFSVCHPLSRKNTWANDPIVHYELVKGDKLRIMLLSKGGGSENASKALVLPPWAGKEGIKKLVIQLIEEAGPNPCPPIIVGLGIGGNLEGASLLAKKALLRPLGTYNPDPELSELERELLSEINDLGIGPQGYGGRITALAVHVEMAPCHIASLPLAINLQCHCHRVREAIL